MSEVKVGDRIKWPSPRGWATVTALTEAGFKYELDVPYCVHWALGNDAGGEHFGIDGEVADAEWFERANAAMREVEPIKVPGMKFVRRNMREGETFATFGPFVFVLHPDRPPIMLGENGQEAEVSIDQFEAMKEFAAALKEMDRELDEGIKRIIAKHQE